MRKRLCGSCKVDDAMLTEPLVWAIFLLPVASFLIIGLVIRPAISAVPALAKASGYLTIIALGIGFALSIWLTPVTTTSIMLVSGSSSSPIWTDAGPKSSHKWGGKA